jgi:uncharacterized protein YndB with AHSA1/START domain
MTDQQADSGRIKKRVLIKASPAIVYHALTDERDLARWFCDRAVSDPRVGGELTACWRCGKILQRGRAVFTRLEPNALVEMLWVDDGYGPDPDNARHTLSYSISTRRGSSEVVMHDADAASPDDDIMEVLDEGWNNVLLELKDFCERKQRSGKGNPNAEDPAI